MPAFSDVGFVPGKKTKNDYEELSFLLPRNPVSDESQSSFLSCCPVSARQSSCAVSAVWST